MDDPAPTSTPSDPESLPPFDAPAAPAAPPAEAPPAAAPPTAVPGWAPPSDPIPETDAATPATPARVLELLPPVLGVSPALAGALGWLVPGLGQIALGRVRAGLVLLATIGGLFLGGLALTDFTAVEPREHQLQFIAQALIGGPTALAVGLTEAAQLQRMPPWLEVGNLFVIVSGLLNLIALCDALGEAGRRNAQARAEHARLRAQLLPPPAWPPASPPTPDASDPPAPASGEVTLTEIAPSEMALPGITLAELAKVARAQAPPADAVPAGAHAPKAPPEDDRRTATAPEAAVPAAAASEAGASEVGESEAAAPEAAAPETT